jgi:hypothetical protein
MGPHTFIYAGTAANWRVNADGSYTYVDYFNPNGLSGVVPVETTSAATPWARPGAWCRQRWTARST